MKRGLASLALVLLAGCPGPEQGAATDSDGATTSTSGGASTTGDATTSSSSGGSDSDGGSTTGEASTSGDPTASPDMGAAPTTGESDTEGAWAPKPCPAIYAQDILPTFELEIAPAELAAIEQEWIVADDNDIPEHPLVSFKYEDTVIKDASVRLRGNSSHWADQKKMQFEVSFNTYDKGGRFQGLKHVLFDAAEYNRSFLRDRLALAILRDAGVQAPCANNARLILNGEYYGLFTSIEKVDSEFLERTFEEPDGNLYKRAGGKSGWKRKNNEEDEDESDIAKLKAVKTLDDLLAVMNLEQALLEWAAEAVIPDRDGAWAGGLNLYVYNDPKTGFNVIPWDLDDTFTRLEPDTDPYTYVKPMDHGRPYYDIATADPVWFERYIEAVAHVLKHGYDVAVLQGRIDAWSAQIAEAAAADPNRPFTLEQHLDQVEDMREFVAERAAFLEQWIACWRTPGAEKGAEGQCVLP